VTNRNAIPVDPNGPWYTSGIRFGTPALTTRGFGAAEFDRVAELVVDVLTNTSPESTSKAKYTLVDGTAERVHAAADEMLAANPLYPGLVL
jgi:glycine hydroxymethyltransferase